MRKAILIALLGMAVLAMASKPQKRNDNTNNMDDDNKRMMEAKPFRAGVEYIFTYNTQVATGLVAPDTSAEPGMAGQKAVTRMETQARIQFSSDRHAILELDQIRLGELNDQMPQPDTVKPMRMFEPKQISQDKYRQLQLPCQFIYDEGVIERIQFHQQDDTWSKNIKRAVLNMIQLNLKKNNAQGLRLSEELSNAQLDQQEETQPGEPESFVLPEITIEGECQTLYTVGQQNEKNSRFNVTKSIDFQRCRKIADVAYGYQTQEQQPQCAQCQQEWYKQQQQDRKPEEQSHPCNQCDPKEVKEQRLSRATVLRFVLNGDQKQHAIQRSELTSQYVYKNLNAEAGQYGSAMHAIVASELIFRSEHQKNQPSAAEQRQSSDKDETLLFSNQWDVDEKRFYMYGDEEYSRNSPFKEVQNKVQQAEQALRKLTQSTKINSNNGIEIEAPIQLQRLVETLRMCSEEELKEIDRAVRNQQQQRNSNDNSEKQTAEQFFIDALAIAATRNTIATLVEKIMAREVSEQKAAQTLKSLQGLPAPSDSQVKMVQRLCQSEVTHRSPALKQSCWLTLGNMINELCQHKTQKLGQQSVSGTQSGFNTEEVCPQDKKQKYREVLTQQFKNADNTYEKVLALKALGNAGIEASVNEIEEIINNQEEERIVRAVAIDTLRRLRTQMPRKIQSILMPLFQNNREEPEIRMAAFAQLMNTQPNQQVIDQIAYVLTQERSQHVLAFAYNSMKSLATTQNPMKQEMAKHVKNALKVLNVDDQVLKSMSGRIQIPIYSQEQNEGVFIDLVAAFSAQNQLPWHIAAELNSVLNDEFQNNDLKLAITQQNIEQLYNKLQAVFLRTVNAYNNNNKAPTRGQRNQGQEGTSNLRDIYTALGIKSRRSSMYQQKNQRQQDQEQPFAMFNLRIKDVDQAIIPASEQNAPQALKAILNGEKFSLQQILGSSSSNKQLGSQHFRNAMATNFNENRACIATSAGLPLKAQQSTPMIATFEAQAELNVESSSLSSPLGAKAQVNAQASLNVAHIQKLECWLPIFATGTGSIRSLELNMPVNAEVTANNVHGLQVKIKVPQNKKVQVLGLHSLPATYTADYDQNKNVLREPKIKAIHCPQIEESQREVNTVIGRSAGLPFHVKGHYYRPSQPSSYKQMVQMLMAAENQVHVTFEPNQQTPREVILRTQGSNFEKIQAQQPELDNFYSKKNSRNQQDNTFEADFENDNDFEGMEGHSQRRQLLNSYLNGQYKAGQMYRHELKMSAQTVGGEKECKAQMEIQSACDAKFKFCKVDVQAERTPLENESNKWTLKAQAQILSPESVPSVEQLDQQENNRNQKFLAQAECQWGANNKQHVNVRIEGEQAKKAQWRKIEEQEQRRNKYYKRQTSFLNKFEIDAEYKLQPAAQNMFSRVFESLKARNFWNTQVRFNNNNNQRSQQQGQVKATVVIDPITQRHANVTVRTPSQAVRIESMELSRQVRPFPLIRPNEKSTHSVQQLFNRWAMGKRAECTADGRRVNTFDNVDYNAPIGKCYSVLAKDCSDDQPRFAVLMKAMDNNNQKKEQQQKKVKVITPEQTIECQPASRDSNTQKMQCRVNGQPAEQHNNDAEDQTIEYNNEQMSDVTINVEGVSVRFNGKKAWIKISSQYKNGQCGLCGHYDDESADELRMNNNELTDDLALFHRSYSLQQNGECTADDQKNFYNQNQKSFARRRNNRSSSSSESDEEDSDESNSEWDNNEQQNEWDDQSFEGDNDSYSTRRSGFNQRRNDQNQRQQNRHQQNDRRSRQQQPEEQTVVMEMGSSKICFSMEPVKQCPRGTYPINQQEQDFGYASDNSQNQKQQKKNGGNMQQKKNVKFACLNRSSEEARRLLREARRGEVLDMSQYQPTMTEQVQQPQQCRRF